MVSFCLKPSTIEDESVGPSISGQDHYNPWEWPWKLTCFAQYVQTKSGNTDNTLASFAAT